MWEDCRRDRRSDHVCRRCQRFESGAADAGVGAVPDDARRVGDERVDRDGRRGRGDDRDGDPVGDHALHAGDGGADDHGRQDRGDDRPQAGPLDRARDLYVRLRDYCDRAEPARAAVRLVAPRGHRRGADPARDRGARGQQLPRRAPRRGLRPRRGGRGDRSSSSASTREASSSSCRCFSPSASA